MKKILVTGVNSYVGNRFTEWVEQYPDDYKVDRVSVRDGKWKELDLSIYETVLHVAGIAHRKETKRNAGEYYSINRDLTRELATKAKKSGVKHFIFLSSMSVYGLDEGVINEDTPLEPRSHYGKSKLQAESFISRLSDNNFNVAIIRPPMIYGKGCKGNYQRLRKLALKTPVFPDIKNKRSMIYIDNLSEFLRLIINDCRYGVYWPQNKDYVNTSELVYQITKVHGQKVKLVKFFNPILSPLNLNITKKVFGNLIYVNKNESYCNSFIDFQQTIKLTEE